MHTRSRSDAMTRGDTFDAKQFRQEYECEFDDDLVTVADIHGRTHTFARRRSEPKVKIEFYGYPITIRDANPYKNDDIRIDAWAPDQENRTQPLLSQTFTRSAFYEAIHEARANIDPSYGMYPQSGEEAFILAWGKENMREIERNYHRRSTTGVNSFTDYGTRESRQEAEQRQKQIEKARLLREQEEERKERELEAIPNWGAFSMGGDSVSFGSFQIIESPLVPEGEVYMVGGQHLAGPKTYAQIKNLGSTDGYHRHQALKELKAVAARDELEAVPGFGSF